MLKTSLMAVATLLLCGCDQVPTSELRHETKVIELDKSELVRAELKMGAGELHVDGGSAKLLEAEFIYNVPAWKPRVEYRSTGVRGDLDVLQPPVTVTAGNQACFIMVEFSARETPDG